MFGLVLYVKKYFISFVDFSNVVIISGLLYLYLFKFNLVFICCNRIMIVMMLFMMVEFSIWGCIEEVMRLVSGVFLFLFKLLVFVLVISKREIIFVC